MNLLSNLFSKTASNILSAIGEVATTRACMAFLDETEVPAELLKEKQ